MQFVVVPDLVEIGVCGLGPVEATEPVFSLSLELNLLSPAAFFRVDRLATCAQECQTYPEGQGESELQPRQL